MITQEEILNRIMRCRDKYGITYNTQHLTRTFSDVARDARKEVIDAMREAGPGLCLCAEEVEALMVVVDEETAQ